MLLGLVGWVRVGLDQTGGLNSAMFSAGSEKPFFPGRVRACQAMSGRVELCATDLKIQLLELRLLPARKKTSWIKTVSKPSKIGNSFENHTKNQKTNFVALVNHT